MEKKCITWKTTVALNNIAVICETRKTMAKKLNCDDEEGLTFKAAAVLEEAFAYAIKECAKNIEIDN